MRTPPCFALAETLHSRGHSATVWNDTPERADGLVAAGVRRAATVAEAVAASPVTIMCLKDYETMYEIFDSAGHALRGRTLVKPQLRHPRGGARGGRARRVLPGGTVEMNLNALEHIARTAEEQGVHTGQPRLMR
ncbi:NAD(P)-binding domain-containing protein [Amycolatopsis tucumanensis]|uniref:NAD(P)-binding domain-containing protein n=1 Tax=Amycolatopsis tucumanensis TaxID=401106 RepID=UPI003D750F53